LAVLIAVLNARFAHGGSRATTSDVSKAGVVLSQFDVMHDYDQPWLPCTPNADVAWCWWLADRWSGSIVHAHARWPYSPSAGGLVVRPADVGVLCAYADDGGTQGEDKACAIRGAASQLDSVTRRAVAPTLCVPGCSVEGQPPKWCTRPGEGSCTWPPTQLGMMLSEHLDRLSCVDDTARQRLSRRLRTGLSCGMRKTGDAVHFRHNEVVLTPEPIVSSLPGSIEAFFVQPGSNAQDAGYVRDAHAHFRQRYGTRAQGVPLLMYDTNGGSTPFSLASAG
jgi:hypothetical protein